MSYASWFQAHGTKHKELLLKLKKQGLEKQEIIAYFRFDNMVKHEKSFCPLYAENKKCHDLEDLNCYLCACPNFRFSDAGIEQKDEKTVHSFCSIESKDGRQGVYGDKIHQDCSKCTVPHHESYIKKHWDEDWFEVMRVCENK